MIASRFTAARVRISRTAALAAVVLAACPHVASAQVWLGSTVPRRGTLEISGGAVSSGGYDMGVQAAEQTRNTGTTTGPFTLFSAQSRVVTTSGAQARLGVYFTRSVLIEGGAQYSRPRVAIRLTNDAEQAAETTATEVMTRYVFDGSIMVHLTRLSFAGERAVPFVSGGAGYIRELHERDELVETGREYHAGGGLKWWFGQGRRRLGLRADVGVSLRERGFDFAETRRTVPTAGASLCYLF